MSSNIKVQRLCQHCSKEFTAKTTVTKYCGDHCAKRAYKVRLRNAKIEQSNEQTKAVQFARVSEVIIKDFLTVKDASVLLNCSSRTIYRLVETGALKASNIAERKILIRRVDIESMFQLNTVQQRPKPESDLSKCYTMKEIQERFGISEKALSEIVRRNNIPKVRKGKFSYVAKSIIDSILK